MCNSSSQTKLNRKPMHNFQYAKEEVSKPLTSKKKFLNAYKAKENKVIVPN